MRNVMRALVIVAMVGWVACKDAPAGTGGGAGSAAPQTVLPGTPVQAATPVPATGEAGKQEPPAQPKTVILGPTDSEALAALKGFVKQRGQTKYYDVITATVLNGQTEGKEYAARVNLDLKMNHSDQYMKGWNALNLIGSFKAGSTASHTVSVRFFKKGEAWSVSSVE